MRWLLGKSLIEVQKKNKQRFNVYIKGNSLLGSVKYLVKFALHGGQVLDKDFIADIQQIDKIMPTSLRSGF